MVTLRVIGDDMADTLISAATSASGPAATSGRAWWPAACST